MGRFLLFAASILLGAPLPAAAEWREVRTDHFRVIGDVPQFNTQVKGGQSAFKTLGTYGLRVLEPRIGYSRSQRYVVEISALSPTRCTSFGCTSSRTSARRAA